MVKKKILIFIMLIFSINFISADELMKIYSDESAKQENRDYFFRKIVNKKDNLYEVQDFYISRAKKTSPYWVNTVNIDLDDKNIREGDYTSWYENGHKQSYEQYIHGMENGAFFTWYETGGKHVETYRYNDKFSGPFFYWHENGKLALSGAQANGKQVGVWTNYDKDGYKINEIFWTKTGKKSRTIKYDRQGNIIEDIKENTKE